MSASPARFTFDLDFGSGQERRAPVSVEASAAQLREARAAGHAEGLVEGERSALARAAQKQAQAIEAIADRAAGAVALFETAEARHRQEALVLASTVARKLAAHLIARQPGAELQAVLADCLASLHEVPHVVVRCHPEVADAVRAAAEARMALTGFAGRLLVTPDPQLGPSDGRIEWADGGISRDMAAISTAIDERIGAFLAAHPPKGEHA